MRPCPASKRKEGGKARLRREVHGVSKYNELEIDIKYISWVFRKTKYMYTDQRIYICTA